MFLYQKNIDQYVINEEYRKMKRRSDEAPGRREGAHDRTAVARTSSAARDCRGIAVGGGVIALFVVLDIIPGWRSLPPPMTRFTGMRERWSAVPYWER